MAALVAGVAWLALGTAAAGAGVDPEQVLSGVARTEHFEIRFRPGSRAEASVDRTAAMIERDLARALEALAFEEFASKGGRTIRLFVYDDVDELQRITGVGAGGFSTTLEMHVPRDDDQTRFHELVHVVAEQFPEQGDEPRNLFFAEGLSNALLEFVHGVPVDAVAAFEKRRGALPALAEVHALGDFYEWLRAHPGVNGYDVAGSYMKYLLDTFGPAKVRAYYKGVPAKKAFGRDVGALEKEWHARLDAVELRPGLEMLLRERTGESVAFPQWVDPEHRLDDGILGNAAEWTALSGTSFEVAGPGEFERSGDGEWTGRAPADSGEWTVAEFGAGAAGARNAMARMTATPRAGCWGVQLQLGADCQAMLLGNGAFLYGKKGAAAHDPAAALGTKPVEIVLRRVDGRARVWIDRTLVLEGDVADEATNVGIAVVQGEALFTDVAFRAL